MTTIQISGRFLNVHSKCRRNWEIKEGEWDAILMVKNYWKKGHCYYFVVTALLLYRCCWPFCQFIDSLQLICFFFNLPIFNTFFFFLEKKEKEWITDNKSNNNMMSLFSFKAGGQIFLLEQRELQRAFRAWKDALAQSI